MDEQRSQPRQTSALLLLSGQLAPPKRPECRYALGGERTIDHRPDPVGSGPRSADGAPIPPPAGSIARGVRQFVPASLAPNPRRRPLAPVTLRRNVREV